MNGAEQLVGKSPGVHWMGNRIDGVVFDVDGTLTDSVEAYYEVFRRATAQFGIHVNREDVLEPMATGALIWDRAIPKDIADRDEKIKQIGAVISEIFPKTFARVRPFPEVKLVLKALKKRTLKLAAATSSWASVMQPLHSHSLAQYFDVFISREDDFLPKPAPDTILECLRRMEVDPGHALTVGDSALDMRAGKAAGTLTIGVLSGIGGRGQLETEAPTAIIESVAELLTILNLA